MTPPKALLFAFHFISRLNTSTLSSVVESWKPLAERMDPVRLAKYSLHYIYILQWIFRFFFLQSFIASWKPHIWLTAAKFTCLRNTLRTLNLFVWNDTGFVNDSERHLSRTCKTSLLFVPLAVRVHTGWSAFSFYTPTKPLIWWHIKYKNSKWVWSGNTTITNRRQPHGTARKSHPTITRHQEDKLSKATRGQFHQ